MNIKKFVFSGIPALALVFGFVLAGCATDPAPVPETAAGTGEGDVDLPWWWWNDDDSTAKVEKVSPGVYVVTGTPQLPDDVWKAKLGFDTPELTAGKTYTVTIELWADKEFRNVISEYQQIGPNTFTRIGEQDHWWFTIPTKKTTISYEINPVASEVQIIYLDVGGDTGTIHIESTSVVEKK
jgi:hypothetical protein